MFNHTVPADFSTLRFFAFLPIGKLSVTENQCQSVCVCACFFFGGAGAGWMVRAVLLEFREDVVVCQQFYTAPL